MHTILATEEAEIGRSSVQVKLRQKVQKNPSQPISQAWRHALVIPATQGSAGRRIVVPGSPGEM
jgi:acyl-CoA hydrolase